jgi:hypothetical protein
MSIDPGTLMPLDPGRYLTMMFASGGMIMVVFYFWELMQRKEGPMLLALAFTVLGGWHYCDVEGLRLPFFE